MALLEVMQMNDEEVCIERVINDQYRNPRLAWLDAIVIPGEFADLTESAFSRYERRPPTGHVCAGCRNEIVDPYYLKVHPNMEFHSACLKCSECQRFLDESTTTFVRDGRTYCKEDYYRSFGQKCARCERICERNDMVMRARHLVFHCDCFSCSGCDRRLSTGDQFLVKGEGIYCRPECENIPPQAVVAPVVPLSIERPSSINTSSLYEDDSWETSTMTSLDPPTSPPLSIRSPRSDDLGFGNGSGSSSSGGKKSKKDKQTTRVRTVLNENQLMILKKCYTLNARPDALMKEQLVEMTGLNARVIRVWFQNKRCKDKKKQIQMRDQMVNAEKEAALNGIRLNGVGPLLAASPTTHNEGHLGGPIEITQYAQWNHHQMDIDHGFHPTGMPPFPDMNPDMVSHFMPPPPGFPDFQSHLHGADMSSPSCSD